MLLQFKKLNSENKQTRREGEGRQERERVYCDFFFSDTKKSVHLNSNEND